MLYFWKILILSLLFSPVLFPSTVFGADPEEDLPFLRENLSKYETDPLPESDVLRQWIAEMKEAPRGPFRRLRWFCNDGWVLPPEPYACRERGGGVQHGEWTEQVKRLRAHGYRIANVLADLDPETFTSGEGWEEHLKQILLERFLIIADDGWIFRRARTYRGALQVENENAFGRGLLLALLREEEWAGRNFLILREAARLLPNGRREEALTDMRQLARRLAEQDPAFEPLRIKLHVHPEEKDAAAVRAYLRTGAPAELAEEFRLLAVAIEEFFQAGPLDESLHQAAAHADEGAARRLRDVAAQLVATKGTPRAAVLAETLAWIRKKVEAGGSAPERLLLLHLSLDLEKELFRMTTGHLERLLASDRGERIAWLVVGKDALYGLGLLSSREREALAGRLQRLRGQSVPAELYKESLDYLALATEWAANAFHFEFSVPLDRFSALDPLVRHYVSDRLRGSPLRGHAAVLDTLLVDANRLVGVRHQIFGAPVASGVRPLNPGLARGRLRFLLPGEEAGQLDPGGIYVLPETVAELAPVSGIITQGRGNALSHVQILARNLGIPNMAAEESALQWLRAYEGQEVVMAVSSGGVIRMELDGAHWDPVFRRGEEREEVLIRPDLERLDLTEAGILPLESLRRSDSGRLAGPKAANLGELRHSFPELVPEGLVLPFGLFRRALDQPITPELSAWEWMCRQYRRLSRMDDEERERAAGEFLAQLRNWIGSLRFSASFRQTLRQSMEERFGPEGSYGVFVRSDTNVEDLPGFTGAGLNRTVPHVVGFEEVLQAILEVWASPFNDRAFRWRQGHMESPEHVYVSVLLMRSVPAGKSGVLVSADVRDGSPKSFTVAVNEGVGGAVSGQRAEEILIDRESGEVTLLARSAEPLRRVLRPEGGVALTSASGAEAVLTPGETEILRKMGEELPTRFQGLRNAEGEMVPADIEFGFVQGRFVLFQIRPYLESRRARGNRYLASLEKGMNTKSAALVDLQEVPRGH